MNVCTFKVAGAAESQWTMRSIILLEYDIGLGAPRNFRL